MIFNPIVMMESCATPLVEKWIGNPVAHKQKGWLVGHQKYSQKLVKIGSLTTEMELWQLSRGQIMAGQVPHTQSFKSLDLEEPTYQIWIP